VALLSVVALLWGIHLAGVVDLSRPLSRAAPSDRSLGVAATLFTIAALIMTAIGIAIVGPSVVFGVYSDWWDAKLLGADQRFVDVGLIFSGAGVYALLATDEAGARWRRWLAYAVLAFCLLVALQKGERTSMVTIGVGAGWCYSQRIGRVRWPSVLALAFAAIVAFPVIREWRAERRIEESKRTSITELFGGSIYSLGGAVNSIIFTVEFIPEKKPYSWGATFASAFVNAIPNPGLTKGKAWAWTNLDVSPSTWITWMVNPLWAAAGGGYGFSMAAEWYYNFGMAGILLGMASVGFGLARARNASTRSSLALLWSTTMFAGTSIWIRNVLGYALKVATWPLIAVWVIDRLLKLMRGRSARRRDLRVAADPSL
jgi:oligosaccharide repeat unit polymerase